MKRIALLAAFASLICSASAINLLNDGGFEMGDIYAGQFDGSVWATQYGYATNTANNVADPGSIWHEGNMRVMDQGRAANNSFTGHSSWNPVTASLGDSFLAVNGATNTQNQPFVLTQVFNVSSAGLFVISFDSVNLYRNDPAGASTLHLYMDNVSLGTTTTQLDNVWRTASFNLNMGVGSHTFKLVADTTQASGNDFGLDNLSVIQSVPEPFSMSLGLAAVGLYIRRRRKVQLS